jgi:tRNA/rRNA methyltransferase
VVSFPLRLVIDLVPGDESEAASQARRERRAWLEQRGYRVVVVKAIEVEADVSAVLERIMAVIGTLQ